MKKRILFFCMLAIFVSCIGNLNENQNENQNEDINELSLTKTEVEFEDAEESSLKVLFVATHDWSAEVTKGSKWLSVEASSGDGSDERQSVEISVTENTSRKSRKGEIVFMMEGAEDQTLVVIQAGAEDSEDDNDDKDDDKNEDVGGGGDSPAPSPSFKRKVKSMHFRDADGLLNRNWDFEYDSKGRVITMSDKLQVQESAFEKVYTYSYSGNQLEVNTSSADHISFLFEGAKVVSSLERGEYQSYHYTAEGQLEKYVTSSKEVSYVWENGNIVQCSRGDYVCTYEYTLHENKANLDFYVDDWIMVPIHVMLDRTTFADFSSRCLLSNCTLGSDSYSFTYDFDAQGYVKKIYCYEGSTLRYEQAIVYDDEIDNGGESLERLVKSFKAEYGDKSASASYVFSYDDAGRIVKVDFSYVELGEPNQETCEFIHSDNSCSVKYTYTDRGEVFVFEEAYYKNSLGLWYYCDDGDITYEDGHVSKCGINILEWSGDNILRQSPEGHNYEYEYLAIENKLNVDVFFPWDRSDSRYDRKVFSDFHSRDLPKRLLSLSGGWSESYTYNFDTEGYVTEVNVLETSPNLEQNSYTITIEYEK